MEIVLASCVLRQWRLSDVDSLVQNANNRKIWANVRDRFPSPYTRADAQNWVNHASTEYPVINFAISVDGKAVGGIGLIPGQDIEKKSAEIGYWLGEDFWGRGIVSDAVKGFTNYAFANFEFCRLWATVFAKNIGSQRVLEKAGYVREGVLHKGAYKNGQILDTILYAITV